MKKIPIVFSIDHNYVMQAGVCILSLLNSSNEEEFYNILEKNMLPVYESARRQGYEVWEC